MNTKKISSTTCDSTEVMNLSITNDPKTVYTEEDLNSRLYQSIRDNRIHDTKLLLKHFGNVNSALFKTGWFAGYTPLHVACMENNHMMVNLLIEDYNADVNVVADEETQPIHLASLLGHLNILLILLNANANVDAEFGYDTCTKWSQDGKWTYDFGDRTTLLAFAVLRNMTELALVLIANNANLKIRSVSNTTLIAIAIELDNYSVAQCMTRMLNDRELINVPDDRDTPAIHFLLDESKYGDFRYDSMQCSLDAEKGIVLKELIKAGADVDALIGDDPDTLLLNEAAYRGCFSMVEILVPYHIHKRNSKALYNATLPAKNAQNYLRTDFDEREDDDAREEVEHCRQACTKYILKNLVNRRSVGVYVPEEEIKLMDKLIATDPDIRSVVHDHEEEFITGMLKKQFIQYGDSSITFYEFFNQVFNDKQLKILVRNLELVNSFSKVNCKNRDFLYLKEISMLRITPAVERFQLLERLKKISLLSNCIPLPYECVLDMIEFLKNEELEKFINTFVNF